MNDKCQLVNCSTDKTKINPSGELVGIHKIGSEFFRILVDEYDKIVQEKPKLGYEFQLLDVSKRIRPMNVLKVDGLQWYEIDDINDLDFAQKNVKI